MHASPDYQPQIQDTVFDLSLLESVDVKPGDMQCQLHTYWEKFACKCPHEVQTHVVQGSTVLNKTEWAFLRSLNKQKASLVFRATK